MSKWTVFFLLSLVIRDLLSRAQNWRFGESRAYERFYVYPWEVSSAVTVCLSILHGIFSAVTVLNSHSIKRLLIHISAAFPSTCFARALSLSECYAPAERANADFPVQKAFSLILSPFPVQRHMSESFRRALSCVPAIRLYAGNGSSFTTVEHGLLQRTPTPSLCCILCALTRVCITINT